VGLFFLFVLVYGVLRLAREWRSAPVRFVVAAESGGFIVRFPPNEQINTAVQKIPGVLPTVEPGAWAVPADAASTNALLRFAKVHDFDFLPSRHKPRTFEPVSHKVD
jgi:hypothetical protein